MRKRREGEGLLASDIHGLCHLTPEATADHLMNWVSR